jgi:hypothetical protein
LPGISRLHLTASRIFAGWRCIASNSVEPMVPLSSFTLRGAASQFTQEDQMKLFKHSRGVVAAFLALAALSAGILASAGSAEARWVCHYSAQYGQACYPG